MSTETAARPRRKAKRPNVTVAMGILDGVPYEDQAQILTKYETPFTVQIDFGTADAHHPDRIVIRSACGAMLSAGPFPTLGNAGVVAEHFEELRAAALSPDDAAQFVETFFQEQVETGCDWGSIPDAPDWYDGYVERRWG